MSSPTDPGADYREAKAAIGPLRKIQADAELAQTAWLRQHRGVPAAELYDRTTGEPTHPELAALDRAVRSAHADVEWCRALVIACGEVVKGVSFAEAVVDERPASVNPARATAVLEGDR